jgi:hypothetical protein
MSDINQNFHMDDSDVLNVVTKIRNLLKVKYQSDEYQGDPKLGANSDQKLQGIINIIESCIKLAHASVTTFTINKKAKSVTRSLNAYIDLSNNITSLNLLIEKINRQSDDLLLEIGYVENKIFQLYMEQYTTFSTECSELIDIWQQSTASTMGAAEKVKLDNAMDIFVDLYNDSVDKYNAFKNTYNYTQQANKNNIFTPTDISNYEISGQQTKEGRLEGGYMTTLRKNHMKF